MPTAKITVMIMAFGLPSPRCDRVLLTDFEDRDTRWLPHLANLDVAAHPVRILTVAPRLCAVDTGAGTVFHCRQHVYWQGQGRQRIPANRLERRSPPLSLAA